MKNNDEQAEIQELQELEITKAYLGNHGRREPTGQKAPSASRRGNVVASRRGTRSQACLHVGKLGWVE